MAPRAARGLREVGARIPTGPRLGRFVGVLRGEAGIGLVEAVIAMALFLIASTALTDVLSSSVNSHGFTFGQTLAQEAADAQIEFVRALPYDSVGTVSGNPPGSVVASESATALGITGLNATVATSIHYVGDGIPGGYNRPDELQADRRHGHAQLGCRASSPPSRPTWRRRPGRPTAASTRSRSG